MSTEEKAIDDWAKFHNLNSEMVCRIVGDCPLVMGADPRDGLVWLGYIHQGSVDTIACWSCVQGENFKTIHERAMNVIESGIGSLR